MHTGKKPYAAPGWENMQIHACKKRHTTHILIHSCKNRTLTTCLRTVRVTHLTRRLIQFCRNITRPLLIHTGKKSKKKLCICLYEAPYNPYLNTYWQETFENEPASSAQLDACQTGDKEAWGSTPAGLATLLRGDWTWKIFYGHSLLSVDLRRAVVSFWRKNVHNAG